MTKILRSTFFADGAMAEMPLVAVNVPNIPSSPFASGRPGSGSGAASQQPVQVQAPVASISAVGAGAHAKPVSSFLSGSSQQQEEQPAEQPAAEQPAAEDSESWSLFGVTMKKLYWILSGVGLVVLLAVVIKYLSR